MTSCSKGIFKLIFLHKAGLHIVILITLFIASAVNADTGGISLGGTRIIYLLGSKQCSLSVSNTSSKSRFLVQSWVTDGNNKKTSDFIVTPPLYISNPKDENVLRIMLVKNGQPRDRETLYYFTARAIPSFEKNEGTEKSVLRLAAATQIKIFVRPPNLNVPVDEAPSHLSFRLGRGNLEVSNNSPYYLTLVQVNINSHHLDNIMIAPFSKSRMPTPVLRTGKLSFKNINDFGGLSSERTVNLFAEK